MHKGDEWIQVTRVTSNTSSLQVLSHTVNVDIFAQLNFRAASLW